MSIPLPEEGRAHRLTVPPWQAKTTDVFYIVTNFLHVAESKRNFSVVLVWEHWTTLILALASVKSLFPFSSLLLLLIFMAFFLVYSWPSRCLTLYLPIKPYKTYYFRLLPNNDGSHIFISHPYFSWELKLYIALLSFT